MLKGGLSYGLIQKFAVLYLVVWTISPPMQIGAGYRAAALICAAVWFVIWIVRENPIILVKDQLYALAFLVAVITVVYIESGRVSNVIKQIAMIMLVICYLMNWFYRDRMEELKGIIPVVLILLIIWNWTTVTALVEDPTLARRLVRDDESTYEYLKQGVGGYSLIYPQVCISPVIVAWVIKAFRNNKLSFAVGAVWLVTYIRFVFLAGYSIAVFATVVGIILLLFYRGRSGVAAFLVAAALFAAAMWAIMYIPDFRNWLLEIFDGTSVAKKINDLVSTGETGEAADSIQSRIVRYSASMQNIFKYPIIGSLWRESGGGHSAFLDVFSKYGVLGIIMFSRIFYTVPVYYKKYTSNKFIFSAANATLITLLFVSVLDSFNYSFTCMILLVAPIFFEDLLKWSGESKE